MDPFSITVGVVGLIGVGEQILSAAFKYVQAVRHADEEISGFVKELTSLLKVLREIRSLADKLDREDATSTETLRAALTDCRRSLDDILGRFRDAKSKVGTGAFVQQVRARLQWPFKVQKTKEMINGLERHKTILVLIMQHLGVGISFDIKRSQHRIETTQQTILQAMAKESTLEEMKESMAMMEQKFAQMLMIIGSQQSISEASISPTSTTTAETSSFDDAEEEKKILEYFMRIDSSQMYELMLAVAIPGTTDWIFEETGFCNWLNGPVKTLWLKGGPGTGKTVLAAAVVKKIVDELIDEQDCAVAFFMCQSSKEGMQNKVGTILSSFAAQLAAQSDRAYERLRKFSQEHDITADPTSVVNSAELEDLVLSIAYEFKTVYVIVDALDEWWTDNGFGPIMDLASHCRRVRIMLTSRVSPSFEEAFHGCVSIDTSIPRKATIESYIDRELERRFPDAEPVLREQLQNQLLEKSKGMYVSPTTVQYVVLCPNYTSLDSSGSIWLWESWIA